MKKYILAIFAVLLLAGCVKKPEGPASKKYDYVIDFDDNFNSGMNSVSEMGISIVIAVDVSGSMSSPPSSGGDEKYIQATNALTTVAEYLENLAKNQKDIKINVAVLKFNTQVETVLPITSLNADGITKLKSVCVPTKFQPGGNTAIGLAMEKSSEILAQSGTIFNSMIIISDGENTSGTHPSVVVKAIYENANNKSTNDIVISTSTQLISFIGFDISSSKFGGLQSNGVRVTSAGNQEELQDRLKNLLEADITKLE